MLHRPLLALTMVGALSAFLPPASAQASAGGQIEPREVRSWLMRIHEAASRRNFQGTFIVSAGGAVSSARIAHFCEGSNQFERIDSLDGRPRAHAVAACPRGAGRAARAAEFLPGAVPGR
jgi:sigma-E factor negative regulatory protein RseB